MSSVFVCVRLPFSFLNEGETERMNNLLISLSSSFITGAFVYYLTVIFKNKNERKNRKWELHDLLKQLEVVNEYVEQDTGLKIDKGLTFEWFKQNYNILIHGLFMQVINDVLEESNSYRYMLTDYENTQLDTIRRNICIFPPDKNMDNDEIKNNFERLKQVCQSIYELNNSINFFVQKF